MFVFDPEVVHQCSMECLGLPKPQMFDVFGRSLAKHYPKVLDFGQPWVYSIAPFMGSSLARGNPC